MHPIPDLLYEWRRGTPLLYCVGCRGYMLPSRSPPICEKVFSLYSDRRSHPTVMVLEKKPPRKSRTPGGPATTELGPQSKPVTPPPPPKMENITNKKNLELTPTIFDHGTCCGHGYLYRSYGANIPNRKLTHKLKSPVLAMKFAV